MAMQFKDLLMLFHQAFQEEDIFEEHGGKFYKHLDKGNIIGLKSAIEQFHQQYRLDINKQEQMNKIINFFEMAFLKSAFSKEMTLTFVIFYNFTWTTCEVKKNEEIMMLQFINDLVEQHKELLFIVSEIKKKWPISEAQFQWLMSALKQSQIYDSVIQLLTIDVRQTPEKIKQRHEDLVFVMKCIQNFHQIGEVQIHRHLLVEYEKTYNLQSQQGAKAEQQLINLEVIQEKLIPKNKSKIKEAFNKLKMPYCQDRLLHLQTIKSELVNFDNYLLKRLIDLSGEKFKDGQFNKNLILLVGPSGSGKTTIMLRILGYDFTDTRLKGIKTLAPVNLRPEHKALLTSPESNSVTRYLFAQQIPKKYHYIPPSNICQICDTPGFQDSAGAQVDASNMISIIKSIQSCRKVKIIVVVSQKIIGERFEGLKNLATIVSNMVINFKQLDTENAVEYIFNKFSSDQKIKQLVPAIANILENISQSSKVNQSYKQFLAHMCKKIGKINSNIICFKPDIDVRGLVSSLDVDNMTTGSRNFQTSWSEETNNSIKLRQQTLNRYIKQFIGKDNNKAYYYLYQLQIMSKSFENDEELRQSLQQQKNQIKKKVQGKYNAFCTILAEQIDKNDANNSTHSTIKKFSQQIGDYQVFSPLISNLISKTQIQSKLQEVKTKETQFIKNISCNKASQPQTIKKIMSIFKFFEKNSKQQQVVNLILTLITSLNDRKIVLKDSIKIQSLKCIKQSVYITSVILSILQNLYKQQFFRQKIDQLNINISNEKNYIEDEIYTLLNKIETKVKLSLSASKKNIQIHDDDINSIKATIQSLKELQFDSLSERTNPKQTIDKIINDAQIIISDLVKNILQILENDCILQTSIQDVKLLRHNINKIYSIFNQKNFRPTVEHLVSKLKQFIVSNKEKILALIEQISTNESISKKTLKKFNKSFKILLKLQEDQDLSKQISKLKKNVRKTIQKCIRHHQQKCSTMKISLKLKKSLNADNINQILKLFYQVSAFYKTKQFKNPEYLCNHSDVARSQLYFAGQSSDSQQQGLIIDESSKRNYEQLIKKFLNPYQQISKQIKKVLQAGFNGLNSKFIIQLDQFSNYRYFLENKDIVFHDQFSKTKNMIISNQQNYLTLLKKILQDVSGVVLNLSDNCKDDSKFIDGERFDQLISIKSTIVFLKDTSKYELIDQLFIECEFTINQTLSVFQEMVKLILRRFQFQLSESKKKDKITNIIRLKFLREKLESIKFYDFLCKENQYDEKQLSFTKLIDETTKYIDNIQKRQVSMVDYLFRSNQIIIKDVKQAYLFYSTDHQRNQDNIKKLYENLRQYGRVNFLNFVSKQKANYLKQNSINLQGIHAQQYINSLEKFYKFFEQITSFINDVHFLRNFSLNQQFFHNELRQINIQEKICNTYLSIQQKIRNFQYKGKEKQFDKIILAIKKVENLKKNLGIEQKNSESEKLKELKLKVDSQFNLDEDEKTDIQQLIGKNNFIVFYHKLEQSPTQKKKFDQKIDKKMANLFQQYQKMFNKSEPQITSFQDRIKNLFTSLPQSKRIVYRQQFKHQKQSFTHKIKTQIKNINKQYQGATLQNLRKLTLKIKQSTNQAVQKQYISLFQKNIKQISDKQIMIYQSNKRLSLLKSLRKYFSYYGNQNINIIRQITGQRKTKQIFELSQKYILSQFSQQLKDMARQLIQQIIKPYHQNLKSFSEKCQLINQVYALILEELQRDRLNKKFSSCFIEWERLYSFINEKIKYIQQYSKQFSFKKIDYSIRTLDKNISDMKMIKVFQQSLINASLNITNLDIQGFQNNKIFLMSVFNDKTQQLLTGILNKQTLQLINSLSKVVFYDDLIKVYNNVTLELQFQKVIKNLKIVKQIEQLNKSYKFNEKLETNSFENLLKLIQQKWQKQIQSCIGEFKQAVFDQKLEISQKINVYYRLALVFEKRQWNYILKNMKSSEKIQQIYRQVYQIVQLQLEIDQNVIKDQLQKKKEEHKVYSQLKNQLEKDICQWKNKLQDERQQFNFKIIRAESEEVKQKLVLDLNNIELLYREKVENAQIQIRKQHENSLKKIDNDIQNHLSTKIVQSLINFKKYSLIVASKAKQSNQRIQNFIKSVCSRDKKFNKILYSALINSKNSYAMMISSEGLFFRGQVAQKFKNKTQKQNLQYIIDNCTALKQDKNLRKQLQRAFKLYQIQYEKNIQEFKNSPSKDFIEYIAHRLMEYKARCSSKSSNLFQPAQVVAKIFSIWSILNADMSDPNNPQIDFQPHPAQIVSILLLIGLNRMQIGNKLIELKTGQGKSIVLAGLCCFLALSGFKAYCACYSEYLSTRDEGQFKKLFEYLGVKDSIQYGTFGEHCENVINQIGSNSYEKSTFRDHIKQLIIENQPKNEQRLKEQYSKLLNNKYAGHSNKILIIDQADVFFNKNFFGQLYIPSLTFKGPQVKDIIQRIWIMTQPSRQNHSLQRITKSDVQRTGEYSKFMQKYQPIQQLMENQIIGILEAVYNFKHSYTIHQQSVKYLENDNITDKLSYGYKTVFANCYEYERKNISQTAYNASLNICISVGHFSYSQLPNFFRNILGVSGTLSSMSDFKLPLLQDKYKITDLYAIPSIYGQSNRTIDKYTLVSDDKLYGKIVQAAKKACSQGKPTIIFFKSIQQIISFYKSPQFKELIDKTTILSQETDYQSRDTIIKRVGHSNNITISTNSFSRGTDFQVIDEKIKEAGGLYVIQTNIPNDFSQFIQVRGRTARQGEKGAFQMIISDSQMQKFGFHCDQDDKFYAQMTDAWNKKQSEECQILRQKVQQQKKKHEQIISLLSANFSRKNIVSYIYKNNMYTLLKSNRVRTLIGIDGTASMGPALQIVKKIISESFIRARQVLNEKQIKGSFENQIAIYRNYNSDFLKLLEYSPFETESQKLNEFLKNKVIEGGYGNEAIEILFQHANSQQNLNQIILIADAKANFPKETIYKRQKLGEKYWIENGFPLTDCDSELSKLIQKKVKVHTLYIFLESSTQSKKQELKRYCQTVSRQTQGISSELVIKEDSANFLTGFLVKNILFEIGGEEKGKELIQNYNLKYGEIPMRI